MFDQRVCGSSGTPLELARGRPYTQPGYVNSLLLNMAIEIVDFPMKDGGSFHSYVSLPEGIYIYIHIMKSI